MNRQCAYLQEQFPGVADQIIEQFTPKNLFQMFGNILLITTHFFFTFLHRMVFSWFVRVSNSRHAAQLSIAQSLRHPCREKALKCCFFGLSLVTTCTCETMIQHNLVWNKVVVLNLATITSNSIAVIF